MSKLRTATEIAASLAHTHRWSDQERDEWCQALRHEIPSIQFTPNNAELARRLGRENRVRG